MQHRPPADRLPTRSRFASLTLLTLVMGLTACASSAPIVYSKKQDAVVMDERTQRDITECRAQADTRVGRNGMNTTKVAQQAGSTAAIGFAATAVGSVVSNSKSAFERARGAAAGGATGMATKLLLEWNEPDDVHQGYVERCLERRGHEVLGWR